MPGLLDVSSQFGWVPRTRDYEGEKEKILVQSHETDERPLQEIINNLQVEEKIEVEEKVADVSDPLGALSSVRDPLQDFDPLRSASENPLAKPSKEDFYDPLTSAAIEEEINPGIHRKLNEEGFVPWESRKQSILKKYTTNERVSITVSFMKETEKQSAVTDTVKDRLEELEESENDELKMVQISQQDYLDKIEMQHNELLQAWNEDQKVKALKIAIQCSKFLSDTKVIKFYPSKFVLITEILDTFGRLVFERLRGRSKIYTSVNSVPRPLPEDFKAEDVTPEARETCRNWFFKIASIRELIPRLYVEMALINCYRFLANNTYSSIVQRISAMLKGIGDPLVATYARAYLARKGREVGCINKEYLLGMYYDHIDTISILNKETSPTQPNGRVSLICKTANIDPADYYDLYTPALEWIIQCVAHQAGSDILDVVLKKFQESKNPLILDHIISSFKPSLISPRALEFSVLIGNTDSTIFPNHKLYRALGLNLVLQSPPREYRLHILNTIWNVVSKFESLSDYMLVAEVLIEFPAKHCSLKEVNLLLGDILEHLNTQDHLYEKFQNELETICLKILSHHTDFTKIFNMDKFMPIVDLLSGDVQVRVNKAILECFCKDTSPTTDPVLINAIFEVGKIVHDSINSMSFSDEIRQISNLISVFIKKINYGMDLEKQLNFYVECRRAFANLDAVKKTLVLVSAGLAMKTHSVIKGKHTKRTAAFVRGCVAFCFITIPSMDDIFQRLHLYLLCGQVALVNHCVPQSEALFEAAIDLIAEVPMSQEIEKQLISTEEPLVQYLSALSSQMIVIPGHPEQGPFFLLKKLLMNLESLSWEKGTIVRSRINLKLIAYLASIVQPSLPYHVYSIESNDILYGGDPDYQREVQQIIDSLLADIMKNLSELQNFADSSAKKYQSTLAAELLNLTITHAELNDECISFASKLFKYIKDQSVFKSVKNTLELVKDIPALYNFSAQLK